MTGEIDYSDVFHNLDYLYKPVPSEDFTSLVFYPISTHIIFVIFILFMPILIMNLLVSLRDKALSLFHVWLLMNVP